MTRWRDLTPRLVLAGVAVALLAVPFTLLLVAVDDRWGWLRRLDLRTAGRLNTSAVAHPGLVTALKAVSTVFHPWTFRVAALLLGGWLLWRGLRRLAAYTLITVLGGGLLSSLVKVLVDRPRPRLPHPVATAGGGSFPSGHALGAVVGVGVLLLVLLPAVPRRARPVAWLLGLLVVVAVGWSRIGLGVHYVSDVLAGYVLGLAWLVALTAVFRGWQRDVGGTPGDDPLDDGLTDGPG